MGQVRATQQACLSHKKREAARQRVKHWRALAKLIHPLHVHISVMCSAFNPSIPGRHELFRPAFVPLVRHLQFHYSAPGGFTLLKTPTFLAVIPVPARFTSKFFVVISVVY